ncbi:hypothetical protein D3C77_758920 [compost metagenome]
MEGDGTLVGIGREVGNEVVDAQCHGYALLELDERQAWKSLDGIRHTEGLSTAASHNNLWPFPRPPPTSRQRLAGMLENKSAPFHR